MTIFFNLLLSFAHAHPSPCESSFRRPVAHWAVAAAALTFVSATDAQPPVDLQLVLATDVSGSINAEEYKLQVEGIAQAVESPKVREAITRCAPRGVALALTEWGQTFTEVIPFRHVYDAQSLGAFARSVRANPRSRQFEETDLENGLRQSYELMRNSGWTTDRRAIDVSSDGVQNVARYIPEMKGADGMHDRIAKLRDQIVGDDVTINALVLNKNEYAYWGPEKSLDAYYRRYVIGGYGAFTEPTQKVADVGRALEKKIAREVCAGINF